MRHAGATLDSICARNADLRRELPTVFDSTIAASVSPGAYMDRLRKLTEFEEAIFLVALTFIDRLCQCSVAARPTHFNIHRLILTALCVASKAASDRFLSNAAMASIGGLGLQELNKLERRLCTQLGWRLLPCAAEFEQLRQALVSKSDPFWDRWHNVPVQDAPPSRRRQRQPAPYARPCVWEVFAERVARSKVEERRTACAVDFLDQISAADLDGLEDELSAKVPRPSPTSTTDTLAHRPWRSPSAADLKGLPVGPVAAEQAGSPVPAEAAARVAAPLA